MSDYSKLSDRELDALVAEKVMGWKKAPNGAWMSYEKDAFGNGGWKSHATWKANASVSAVRFTPSTDIAAAWQVVEKMKERQWNFTIADLVKNKWRAEFGGSRKHKQTWEDADTAPRAICLAALKAVGVAPSKEKDAEPCGNTGCAKDHDALGRHQP